MNTLFGRPGSVHCLRVRYCKGYCCARDDLPVWTDWIWAKTPARVVAGASIE